MRLKEVLQRKNPYLFRARGLATPRELVHAVLDAYLSSQEETLLGNFLEGLAIFICGHVYGGRKSCAEGIDLELEKDGKRYLVAIKSGPNWGNSSQLKRMCDNFSAAARIYRQGRGALPVECINGCCYGKQSHKSEDKGNYRKLVGQRFWEFLSGEPDMYIKIIEPIGHDARERNVAFRNQLEIVLDQFVNEFRSDFCDSSNAILWERLIKLTSEGRD